MKKTISIALLTLLIASFTLTFVMPAHANPKSLYVIDNINATPTPISAYDVQPAPSYLAYQATYGVPRFAGGAVGLAIDSDSATLFVTYEVSNTIQLLDATTMTSLGTTTAPGASNLAGIVVDHDKDKVYTIDRSTNKLYVYSWNAVTKILSLDAQLNLAGVTYAHGLALDEANDLLYVGDLVSTNNVRVFSTSGWAAVTSYSVSQKVMGIALDAKNGIFYTGNAYPPYGSLGLLIKYDIGTSTETSVNIRTITGDSTDNVVGLAVDPDSGLVYITTGNQGIGGSDKLMVFDSTLTNLYSTGDIGNPTGIAIPIEEVSFNPLGISKSGSPNPVAPGGTLTYTINFDNTANTFPVNNGVITDTLPPETDFVSADCGGVYNAGTHTVTWNIVPIPAGGGPYTRTVVVTVKLGTALGTVLDNVAVIESDETPPTTTHEYTTVDVSGPSVPEFGFSTTIFTSLLAVLYMALKRRYKK